MNGYGPPQVFATGLRFPEGPVPMADGSVLLVEIARGTLTRALPDGSLSVVAELGGGPNGLAIGPDGAAYVCNNGGFEWIEAGGLLFPGHAAHAEACGSIQRVDLTTGAVDVDLYAGLSLGGSMMMFLPLIVGTVLATPLMRLAKDPMKLHRILMLVEAISAGLLFVLHIVGILPNVPALFFTCLAITATCIGIDYIPQETVNIECMDYELHVGGKDRAATCNAANKFINKAQNALASAAVGAVLVAIGYIVDSETDTYIGELSKLPSLLTWFVVIMGLIPAILGVIAYFILRQYPINDAVRAEMKHEVKA